MTGERRIGSDIECPFCGERDFYLWGLKLHLTRGHCNEFDDVTEPRAASGEAEERQNG